ncbi:hypothetical protein, partial [Dubosiella newyorkensis]|uniref:hypothetical protein n=1 Tax=Dubosiella newyorkensis TaxID=1862672 RepID=UPI00272DA4C2
DRYDRYPRSKAPDYYYYEDDYHYKDRPSSSSSKRERERYHDWDRGRDREFDRDWSPERDWAREKERRRDWDSERERDRARSWYREPERGREYDPDWDYEYREHDRYHDRDPYRDYDRDLYREYDRDPYRDYDGRRYDDDWDRDFDYRSDDYPDDSKLPIKRETPVAIILPSNFSLPTDLTKAVAPRQIHFAPLLSEKKNEGNKRIEVIAPHYILEKYVRRNLEPSGKIERYHRLSYCSVFAEFFTRTMAEHAIARLNRRKTLGNTKDSNYIFQFADPVKVDSMIIERHAAEREICDPPLCLLLGNPDFPKDKINNYFQPFDLERIEHLPNKSILTYHRNMASVNDFYLAFGPKHLS